MFGLDLRFSEDRHETLPYTEEHIKRINVITSETIDSCYKKAKSIIEKNVNLIKKLVEFLCDEQTVVKEDAEKILKDLGGVI